MKTMNEFCIELQYLSVEKSTEMSIGEVADAIRKYIRDNGFGCLDEFETYDEYVDEHDIDDSDYYERMVTRMELPCECEYANDGVAYAEFIVWLYGDGNGNGFFAVE